MNLVIRFVSFALLIFRFEYFKFVTIFVFFIIRYSWGSLRSFAISLRGNRKSSKGPQGTPPSSKVIPCLSFPFRSELLALSYEKLLRIGKTWWWRIWVSVEGEENLGRPRLCHQENLSRGSLLLENALCHYQQ